MSEILNLSTDELTPDRGAVLESQGIPAGVFVPGEVEALYITACGLLSEVAAPAGILREISLPEFAAVYRGEGRNEPRTPVGDIYVRAERLALYAVTLGERVSDEIAARFRSNDLALASMLDAAASVAADRLAEVAAVRFLERLSRDGGARSATRVLGYSPGYCGWHVSGQKKLFEFLQPEQIGITLRDSFLMQPLKSVSGVLIAGPREIHRFEMSYPFCSRCETQGCRERIRALSAE
jgi:hypothetical protein